MSEKRRTIKFFSHYLAKKAFFSAKNSEQKSKSI
nr:MAG TPA: hypothetical protein [Caudoviricetes sp.]